MLHVNWKMYRCQKRHTSSWLFSLVGFIVTMLDSQSFVKSKQYRLMPKLQKTGPGAPWNQAVIYQQVPTVGTPNTVV